MIELLKLNRLQMLKKQYRQLKNEAKSLMKKADLTNYLNKLDQASKVLMEYNHTLKMVTH